MLWENDARAVAVMKRSDGRKGVRFFVSGAAISVAALGFVPAGCGGTGNDDLFHGSNNPAGQGGGAGSGGTPFDSSGFGATGGGGFGGVGGDAGSFGDAAPDDSNPSGEAGPEAGDAGTGKPGAGTLSCGERTCSLTNMERCCVTGGATFPFPTPPTLACSTSGNCTVEYRCDGSEDCPGQVCCGIYNATATNPWSRFECRNACEGDDVTVGCAGRHNCPDRQICCGTTTPTGLPGVNRYVSTQCAATCEGQDKAVLCDGDADCTNMLSCLQSQVLPAGYKVCR